MIEVRKAPKSGEFFIIGNIAYELVDSRDDPKSCEFWPEVSSHVLSNENIKKISFSEIDNIVKRGFIIFIMNKFKNV